jgi:predicted nucleotidyltransferase
MIYREMIEKRRIKEIESIRTDAIAKGEKVAELLKRKYGVRRVILFGSICQKAYIHRRSDIDLMVEGLKSDDFLRAGFDAWVLSKPFDVDIIPLERAETKIYNSDIRIE